MSDVTTEDLRKILLDHGHRIIEALKKEKALYVYIQSEPGLWTAGFYRPDGRWEAESDHDSWQAAAARVHYLNGGLRVLEPDEETESE